MQRYKGLRRNEETSFEVDGVHDDAGEGLEPGHHPIITYLGLGFIALALLIYTLMHVYSGG